MSESAADRDVLVSLAGEVADRTPVDWDARQSRTPEEASALARLRELAALEAAMARLRDGVPAGVQFTWGTLHALECIGEGSFAEVWRAWDPTLQREVALKLRREGAGGVAGARRWVEEARRLARVRHPHVLAILGADEHDGRAGLWTELIAGTTLEDWIASGGPLGPREAAAVGLDLCNALAAVHATGLVHGDVTTRNVMREGRAGAADRSGRIVLMDFGSARDAHSADLATFGTPVFMAPEVLAGEAPDARADLYALGVVLYRLLTARYPVPPGPPDAMRRQLLEGGRTPLREARPDLPAALVQAVERACAPAVGARFDRVAELEQALAAAVSVPAEPDRQGRRRARVAAVFAVAATLLGLAVAVPMLRRPSGDAARPTASPAPSQPPAASAAPALPPALPPAPAASPRPAAPELDATLLRVTAGAREALRTGDLVAPGDELALEVLAREPLHVYVLSEDDAGAVFVLFPLADRGASNPVPSGPRRLPGRERDRELSWQVTSAGGRETFLLLASREPLAPVVEAVAALPQARPDAPVAYGTLPPEALARLRGVGGVVSETPLRPGPRASILSTLSRDLSASTAGRAMWMRLLVLENPAH